MQHVFIELLELTDCARLRPVPNSLELGKTKPEQSLEAWRDAYARDPSHPVLGALAVRAATLLEQLANWGQLGHTSPDWWEQLPQMPNLLSEFLEVASWLPLLPGVPEGKREQRTMLEAELRRSDLSYDYGRRVMEAFGRSGAPITARLRAIHALEMLLAGSDWSTIIAKLCPYRHTHTADCGNAIRRGVTRLKQLLRKHDVMRIPTRLAIRRS